MAGFAVGFGGFGFWVLTFAGAASGADGSGAYGSGADGSGADGSGEDGSGVPLAARLAARLARDLVREAAIRMVLADELAGLRGILPPWSVCGLPPALSYRRRSSHKSADLNRRHA
jgi:hypothetical protein